DILKKYNPNVTLSEIQSLKDTIIEEGSAAASKYMKNLLFAFPNSFHIIDATFAPEESPAHIEKILNRAKYVNISEDTQKRINEINDMISSMSYKKISSEYRFHIDNFLGFFYKMISDNPTQA